VGEEVVDVRIMKSKKEILMKQAYVHKFRKLKGISIFTLLITLLFIFAWNVTSVAEPTSIARIIDIKGHVESVSNLKAVYMATGNWFAGAPIQEYSGIVYSYSTDECHSTYTKSVTVPFFEIKKILIDTESFTIHKKNGEILQLSSSEEYTIEEKDSSGETLIEEVVEEWSLNTEEKHEVQGRFFNLSSFKGETKTKSGKLGTVEIPEWFVRTIIFE